MILKLHFGARADPCADSRLTAVSRERERVSVTYVVLRMHAAIQDSLIYMQHRYTQ